MTNIVLAQVVELEVTTGGIIKGAAALVLTLLWYLLRKRDERQEKKIEDHEKRLQVREQWACGHEERTKAIEGRIAALEQKE